MPAPERKAAVEEGPGPDSGLAVRLSEGLGRARLCPSPSPLGLGWQPQGRRVLFQSVRVAPGPRGALAAGRL